MPTSTAVSSQSCRMSHEDAIVSHRCWRCRPMRNTWAFCGPMAMIKEMLRTTQQLGDFVLAHTYVREDHVFHEELPHWVPISALAEIQVALEKAVSEIAGSNGVELKRLMRIVTVASTDNRNQELLPDNTPQLRFSQSRAMALDMESATIAVNGFRFRVLTAPCCL
jgi:hypothetical protein